MALLNPPELRVSVLALITKYLASRHGNSDQYERMLDAAIPPSIGSAKKVDPEALQRDVKLNVSAGTMLGLFEREGDEVRLGAGAAVAVKTGQSAFCSHLRGLVLAAEVNEAPWGGQAGARDLTNSLAWFLTFPAERAPQRMDGTEPSARTLLEIDFGPRVEAKGEDDGGWPIGNDSRWSTFIRWACSLGFAWRAPGGALVPDPTPAIRDVLPQVFGKDEVLTASRFVDEVGRLVPVLDGGTYRQFVEANRHERTSDDRLTGPLSDAIARLRIEKAVDLEDRADAPRLNFANGTTFSHVRKTR
jgi:hypothetical protein